MIWIGGIGGLEQRLVPQHGWKLETLPIAGVRGKGLAAKLTAPFRLARAIAAAHALFKRHTPQSVLSMGGYAAAPGGLAARLAKIPLVVHEQNRVPGMTNRMLQRFATRVLTGLRRRVPHGRVGRQSGARNDRGDCGARAALRGSRRSAASARARW